MPICCCLHDCVLIFDVFFSTNEFADLPSKPVIIKKSVRVYNWETLKFAWRIKQHDEVYRAHYTAWYKRVGLVAYVF